MSARSEHDVAAQAQMVRWGFGVVVSLMIVVFDPFGFSSHTDRLSNEILSRVAGDWILGRSDADASGRRGGDRSPISVVLVKDGDAWLAGPPGESDDRAPEDTSRAVPEEAFDYVMPVAFHARLLERVLRYEPAGVFLDYRFLLDRSEEAAGIEQLLKIVDDYRCAAVPMFVVIDPESRPPDGMDDQLYEVFGRLDDVIPEADEPEKEICSEQDLAGDGTAPQGNPFVTATQAYRPDSADRYPLALIEHRSRGETIVRPSPALAIYHELCPSLYSTTPLTRDLRRPDLPELCSKDPKDLAQDEDALRILWGSSVASPQRKWQTCREPEHWLGVLWQLARGNNWGIKLDCGHQPTLQAEEIIRAKETLRSGDLCKQPLDPDSLAATLCGRMIMIGPLSFTLPDTVVTPTTQALPAVYLHAMALDNLIALGDNYKRDLWQPVAGLSVQSVVLQLLVYAVMAGFGYTLFHVSKTLAPHVGPQLARHLVHGVVIGVIWTVVHLGVAAAVAWTAFSFMDLAPVNWVGVFLTGLIIPPLFASPFFAPRERSDGAYLPSSGQKVTGED